MSACAPPSPLLRPTRCPSSSSELPDLEPDTGQVRIAVEAAGVHLLDTTLRRGEAGGPLPPPELPTIPGREVAGVVDVVGEDVDEAWLGRRVVAHLGLVPGGYAEQAVTSPDLLFDGAGPRRVPRGGGRGRDRHGPPRGSWSSSRRAPTTSSWCRRRPVGSAGCWSRPPGRQAPRWSRRPAGPSGPPHSPASAPTWSSTTARTAGRSGCARRSAGSPSCTTASAATSAATCARAAATGWPAGHVRLLAGRRPGFDYRRPGAPRDHRGLEPRPADDRRCPAGSRAAGAGSRAGGGRGVAAARHDVPAAPTRPARTPTSRVGGPSARSCWMPDR